MPATTAVVKPAATTPSPKPSSAGTSVRKVHGRIEPAEPVGDGLLDVRIGRPQGHVAIEQPRCPFVVAGPVHGRLVGLGPIAERELRGAEGGRRGVGHRCLRARSGQAGAVHGTPRPACRGVAQCAVEPPSFQPTGEGSADGRSAVERACGPFETRPSRRSSVHWNAPGAADGSAEKATQSSAASIASTLPSRRRWRSSPLKLAPRNAITHS